jgi:hypothetical protein
VKTIDGALAASVLELVKVSAGDLILHARLSHVATPVPDAVAIHESEHDTLPAVVTLSVPTKYACAGDSVTRIGSTVAGAAVTVIDTPARRRVSAIALAMIVTVPVDMPVTTPPDVTVAMDGSVVDHRTPVLVDPVTAAESVSVSPVATVVEGALMVTATSTGGPVGPVSVSLGDSPHPVRILIAIAANARRAYAKGGTVRGCGGLAGAAGIMGAAGIAGVRGVAIRIRLRAGVDFAPRRYDSIAGIPMGYLAHRALRASPSVPENVVRTRYVPAVESSWLFLEGRIINLLS